MIALSLALCFVASLAFAAFLLWRRDRYRTDVRDQIVSALTRLAAIEARRGAWNDAAAYVEGERVKRGISGR